jgi:hypothetical protein
MVPLLTPLHRSATYSSILISKIRYLASVRPYTVFLHRKLLRVCVSSNKRWSIGIMIEWLQTLLRESVLWIEHNAWWVSIFSAVMFVGSLLVIRFLMIRIPSDYFLHPKQQIFHWRNSKVLGFIIFIGKNLIGFILMMIGLLMSVPGVPGQGILTILIGISLMNFPGRRRLELKIIQQKMILKSINAIRAKANKSSLILPDDVSKQ